MMFFETNDDVRNLQEFSVFHGYSVRGPLLSRGCAQAILPSFQHRVVALVKSLVR
jgi:hypothetical protein